MNQRVYLTECPRDAMQGIHDWIPTETKTAYNNQLLKCGFDVLDFGSFVSPRAIPQMRDTADVLRGLDLSATQTKLLAIIANERGAEDAAQFDEITFLGYPFSISETFQQRNTNASIAESMKRVESIADTCAKQNKELMLYLSMGFGNPYGDPWSAELLLDWCNKLADRFGAKHLALSDTIGTATPELVKDLFSAIIPELPDAVIGAHLHTVPQHASALVEAAWQGGCRHFDGAIKGFGGCPMAKDELTGNMPTERMIAFFDEQGIETGVDSEEFNRAMALSSSVFV